jgi:hypothetical protein
VNPREIALPGEFMQIGADSPRIVSRLLTDTSRTTTLSGVFA